MLSLVSVFANQPTHQRWRVINMAYCNIFNMYYICMIYYYMMLFSAPFSWKPAIFPSHFHPISMEWLQPASMDSGPMAFSGAVPWKRSRRHCRLHLPDCGGWGNPEVRNPPSPWRRYGGDVKIRGEIFFFWIHVTSSWSPTWIFQ